HEHDAEDAFQATFLVLARNTGAIRKRETVANWLHGVAYRTALKAKRSAARRRNHEARLRLTSPRATASPTWDEVQGVLDEEIQRLPEPFRAAFVLCVLESKTVPEAAAELGCKKGTVSSRLTRARRRLQQRLARRGITLTALLAALSLTEPAGKAAMPRQLARAAIRSGLLVAADSPAAAVIPSRVAALAAGVTRAMLLTKSRLSTVVMLALGVLAAGAGLAARQARGAKEPDEAAAKPQATAKPQVAPKAGNDKQTVTYSGRVLGPDGQPVADAKLYLTLSWSYVKRPSPSPAYASTGPDGRFQFTVPKAKFGDSATTLAATAANHGVAWVDVPMRGKRENLTLQLVKDVPINGQVVDLQGRPVRGVTVRLLHIRAAPKEDLRSWLEAVKAKQEGSHRLEGQHLSGQLMSQEISGLPQKANTNADGRFRLTGIGRERMIVVQIEGPTIATKQVRILTRPGEAVEVPEWMPISEPGLEKPPVVTYHGATFKQVVGPTKPIAGVVRDKDTKEPLAGVTIKSYKLANHPIHGVDFIQTTTDGRGRYRLTGMPKGSDNKILFVPRDDQPYLTVHAEVPDTPGLEPVTVNWEMKRGVWFEGKITDKVTGKPLAGHVDYVALPGNPHLREYAGYEGTFVQRLSWNVRPDGTYRVVGLPGPGILAVVYSDHYLDAHERDDAEGAKKNFVLPMSYNAMARVNPSKNTERATRNVMLDPGETINGRLVGPDAKPLAGVRTHGLTRWGGWEQPALQTAEFTVRAFNPRRPRAVLFHHAEKRLVGALEPPKDKGKPVMVMMRPGATVTGRFLDADGQPRANVALSFVIRLDADGFQAGYLPDKIQTDKDGRFRIEALLPGYEYTLRDNQGYVPFGAGLRSGETKDLGDVRLKSYAP
ncbi:MAG: sigma-70 family RNA polymerase sigma factor, partial [Planctomycetes bacterium]|nr:sigma-70 family RNA polymerase sigma factor [Planctomycetota bacterium]